MKTLLTLVALAAACFGAAKPNFNGTWKLNPDESRYLNKNNVPTVLLKIVDLQGDSLHYRIERELRGEKTQSDIEVTIGESDPGATAIAPPRTPSPEVKCRRS